MNKLLPTLALACVTALTSVGALARDAVVTYSNVDDYTDFPYSESETLRKLITEHFITQTKGLTPGHELKIEVLDINLAGDIKPNFRTPTDIRVHRGRADGPEMKVRFSITENGKVLVSGEESMTDTNYLRRSNRYYKDDELRYEKQMIDDWLSARFGLSL
ncbi:MAG TPA: DUF3016 domain-containing protein [Telluria sp.]